MYNEHPVSDIDSLFRLPLEPLASLFQSASFSKNILTKERLLDPNQGAAVEFFRSKKSGGGMRSIADTIKELNLSEQDSMILTAFGSLPSYDPFSLRTALREALYRLNRNFEAFGVVLALPQDLPLLRLTPEMEIKLSDYTKILTKPLVRLIMMGTNEKYSEGVETPANMIALVKRAREHHDQATLERLQANLTKVGHLLGCSDIKRIEIELAAYGEAMLSLGYLKKYYFDIFLEPFHVFLSYLMELEKNKKLHAEVYCLYAVIKSLRSHLKDSMSAVEEVLRTFDQKAVSVWEQATPAEFLSVRKLILESHDHLASILCGWGARVGAWNTQMEAKRLMSPSVQAAFIIHNINPGIDKLPTGQSLRLLVHK